MARNKKNTTKTEKTSTVEKIDVNDTESMFNDMKKLVFEEVQEEGETTDETEEVSIQDTNETEEKLSDSVTETTVFDTVEETNVEETSDAVTETVEETVEEENVSKEEDIPVEEENIDEVIEEMSSLEAVDNYDTETNNKPKRKSYAEMFGYSWMGYGYN